MNILLSSILSLLLLFYIPGTHIGAIHLPNNTMILPSQGWWDAPIIDNWGQYPDPEGPFAKPDLNILLPANYPIVAPLPGKITGINAPDGSVPFFGATITVRMDKPINTVAVSYSFLHLQRIQPGLQVGMHINAGQVLAYGGAGQTAGVSKAAVGFALYPGDNYGFGPEWVQYIQRPSHTIDPRLDPHPLYNSIKNGSIGIDFAQNFSTFPVGLNSAPSSNQGLLNKVSVAFKPNESVAAFFTGIDEIVQVVNPVPTSTDVDQLDILGATFPNPISWVADLLFNLFIVDGPAVLIRSILIIVGVLICYRVISSAIGVSIAKGASTSGPGISI